MSIISRGGVILVATSDRVDTVGVKSRWRFTLRSILGTRFRQKSSERLSRIFLDDEARPPSKH